MPVGELSASSTATRSESSTHPERIRLNGIDCPEKGQAYGSKAKQVNSDHQEAQTGGHAMISYYDRRLGMSDAVIEPFKGLVDCGGRRQILPSFETLSGRRERYCLMKQKRHYYTIATTVSLFLLVSLLLPPVPSFSQLGWTDEFKQMHQYHQRYVALAEKCELLANRYLDKRPSETDLLMSVCTGVNQAGQDVSALQGYWYLIGMVKQEKSDEAIAFIKDQYPFIKKRIVSSVNYIEKILQTTKDQQTTQLLVEARDLHRSFLGYLGRYVRTDQ